MDFSRSNRSFLEEIVTAVLELLAPTSCCHCHKNGPFICKQCFTKIEYSPVTSHLIEPITVCTYSGPVASLIKAMKFNRIKAVCQYLAELSYYSTSLPQYDFFCPLPLHPKRKNHRGFDQASELCKQMSKLYATPMVHLLERNVYLSAQSGIANKEVRLQRMQNIFKIREKERLQKELNKKRQYKIARSVEKSMHLNNCEKSRIQHAFRSENPTLKVLLIDDVFTTGATTTAAKTVIQEAFPVTTVDVFCFARD